MKTIYFYLAVLLLLGCDGNKKSSVEAKEVFTRGFVIYFKSDLWCFIPSSNTADSCDIYKNNLEKGFQFAPNISEQQQGEINAKAIAIEVENINPELSTDFSKVSMFPVKIGYKILHNKTTGLTTTQPHLELNLTEKLFSLTMIWLMPLYRN